MMLASFYSRTKTFTVTTPKTRRMTDFTHIHQAS